MGYKIWVLAEAYGYRVQFEPYQGVQKGKQVASFAKRGLGENDVLCNMKNRFRKCTGDKQLQKKRGHFK